MQQMNDFQLSANHLSASNDRQKLSFQVAVFIVLTTEVLITDPNYKEFNCYLSSKRNPKIVLNLNQSHQMN